MRPGSTSRRRGQSMSQTAWEVPEARRGSRKDSPHMSEGAWPCPHPGLRTSGLQNGGQVRWPGGEPTPLLGASAQGRLKAEEQSHPFTCWIPWGTGVPFGERSHNKFRTLIAANTDNSKNLT